MLKIGVRLPRQFEDSGDYLADARALDALPGIGPVLAARIVQHRREHGAFRDPDELLAVRGIGPRLLERLRPLVTASIAQPTR